MDKGILNTTGQQWHEVFRSITLRARTMMLGDILQIVGDCPEFEKVVFDWCRQIGKQWLVTKDSDDKTKTIWIEL